MTPSKFQRLLDEAIAHHKAGRFAAASAGYGELRAASPGHAELMQLSGLLAFQLDRKAEAVGFFEQALRLNPRSDVLEMRLGLALASVGRIADAERRLRSALGRNASLADAWENLAYCLKVQDRLAEAVDCHRRCVSLRPKRGESWYNFGLTLSLLGRIAEALECHERAVAVDPACALGHFGRAQALQQSHRMREAVEAYDRFLAAEPGNLEARSYRLFALQYLDGIPRERILAEHRDYGRRAGTEASPLRPDDPSPDRRLRVGILSPDLRAHSCAYFIEPIIRHLDAASFELFLYLDHFREDAVSARLRALAPAWRNVVGRSGPEVEAQVRGDRIDILIDLAGHTGMTNRLGLFARRLAPVQATYLGYPDTTGVAAMDYRLTDAVADPAPEADHFATEQLVRYAPTAWAYQPPPDAPEPNAPPCLAGAPVTFGCFNNLGKVGDSLLALWGRVLAAVPGSRLALKGRGLGEGSPRQGTLERMARAGIDPARVDLLERTAGVADHLGLYHRIDISLDTVPYNGTTTTCESLWMGVPVVTTLGDRHVSRVSASLLAAAGLADWAAPDADGYVRVAAGLASSPERLAGIRAGLRARMAASPLLDHAGQAARFGAALRRCWKEKVGAAAGPPGRAFPAGGEARVGGGPACAARTAALLVG